MLRGESTVTASRDDTEFLDPYWKRVRMGNAKKAEKKKLRVQTGFVKGIFGSSNEVLDLEIQELLEADLAPEQLPEPFTEIELKITKLSSTGDGLALSKSGSHVYIVPFSIPGDTVLAKVVKHVSSSKYSQTDFLRVIHPSPERNDSLIKCKYFSTCSGCQLQMMSSVKQLEYKQRVVKDAYRYFSGLPPEAIPEVESTHGSPLQYGYRTKLTPHFDYGYRKRMADGIFKWTETPPIGFAIKGLKKTMDIEECPIGTEVVNKGLLIERERVKKEIETFKQGATLLLRESTKRIPKAARQANGGVRATQIEGSGSSSFIPSQIEEEHQPDEPASSVGPTVTVDHPTYTDVKTCMTSHNALSTEYVSFYTFTNTAGSFFQNNNSILDSFTSYIRSLCHPPPLMATTDSSSTAPSTPSSRPQPSYLLDAYCGSGLFAITLSSLFRSTLGIDIDERGIAAARRNAQLNASLLTNDHHQASSSPLPPNSTSSRTPFPPPSIGFIAADAARLFVDVPFPPSETLVVIDPPRKGCSLDFLRQLRRFGPRRIVYVSCNVHSQARDVGWLVKGEAEGEEEKKETATKVMRYRIERLAGWDFFPQTAHVEGVAVLERVDA